MKTLDYTGLCAEGASKTIEGLQQLLADFQIHYTNLRGLHWNITGRGFFTLHPKFEDLYNGAAQKIDEIAERILTLGGVPENRFSAYLSKTTLKEQTGQLDGEGSIRQILEEYKPIISKEREVLAAASAAGDEVTVSQMSDYLAEQEKLVWMLAAYLS